MTETGAKVLEEEVELEDAVVAADAGIVDPAKGVVWVALPDALDVLFPVEEMDELVDVEGDESDVELAAEEDEDED